MSSQAGLRLVPLLLCSCFALSCCDNGADFILGQGGKHLNVAVRTSFAGWYFRDGQPTGLEYDLLKAFAEQAGKTLHINFVDTAAQTLALLERNDIAMAAGLLVLPESYHDRFVASSDYFSLRHELIHRYTRKAPDSVDKLLMRDIEIGDNPAHEESLRVIRRVNNDATKWSANAHVSAKQLINLVDQGVVDHAIVDSAEVALLKSYYPRIKIALAVSDELPAVWVLDETANVLAAEVNRFFKSIKADRQLSNIIDRHFGHVELLDYASRLTVIDAFEKLSVSKYMELFYETGKKFNIDWRLLAAISYQESHWHPDAQSPTGVRGMMMITKDIAEQFDVDDRLDPKANLYAGTAYLLQLKKQLPKNIHEPDRTWYALVAYNAGYQYLRRAIRRTGRKNLNTALWVNLRATLQEMHDEVKNGVTINMPIKYVYNIRAYYDLIRQRSGENMSLFPQSETLAFPLHSVPETL